jgi:hypothetical protein
MTFIVLSLLVENTIINSFAQDSSVTTPEEFFSLGPFTFSSKIDLGILIAAAAFASTIIYNVIEMRRAEVKLRNDLRDRYTKHNEQIKHQQNQLDEQKKLVKQGFG